MHRMAFGALAVALLVGCGASDETAEGTQALASEGGHFRGSFTPEPDPPTTGENALALGLTDAPGVAIDGATLAADPWMPSMGHGSPVAPTSVELGGGDYRIEHLSYTMPGDWEVRVDVSAGGVTDRFVVPLGVQ